MAVHLLPRTGRTYDLITLHESADGRRASPIHRHDSGARVERGVVAPSGGRPHALLGDSRACLLAGRMTRPMREQASWGRFLETLTGVAPGEGGGVGLVPAHVLFASVPEARRWLAARPAEKPAALLKDLLGECPRVDAVVLVLKGDAALVGSRTATETVGVTLPTLPLRPRLLAVAEVACHALAVLPPPPSVGQVAAAVAFALEAAASPGGLDEFPALRRRYAALCERLTAKPAADAAA